MTFEQELSKAVQETVERTGKPLQEVIDEGIKYLVKIKIQDKVLNKEVKHGTSNSY